MVLSVIALVGLFCSLLAVVAGGVYVLFPYSVLVGKFRTLLELLTLLTYLKYHALTKNGTVWSYVDDFERLVDTKEDIIQFIFVENDQYVSRMSLERQANQVAHWAKDELKLQQKDTVALMMLNRPEFVSFWLGVSKIGVRTALLNTNITGKPFLHSVSVSVADSSRKVVVIDGELRAALTAEIADLSSQGITVLFWDEISKRIDTYPTDRPDRKLRNEVKESEPFLYIFTSGTTGLPKASKISHTRYYLGSIPLWVVCYLRPGMRVYNCLPLYHSAGGMLGVGGVLVSGATLVVR
jgi:acyl-CoA synthetase (AMP-forming)/AMP-acid ligase II